MSIRAKKGSASPESLFIMDMTLLYEVITAATAVSSGFAGARSADLGRDAGRSEIAMDRFGLTGLGRDLSLMQRGVREAISEKCKGTQNAATWLATSTALFGVATTRPASDPVSVAFVSIAAALVVIAVRAILNAHDAAKLPPARVVFQNWYLGVHPEDGSAKWSEEQIADAFEQTSRAEAAVLRKFNIWPFPPAQMRRHTLSPSDYHPYWG